MELLLIRHAIPVRREVEVGPADPDLSEAGWRQARLLADYLASEKIDSLYASPMRRSVQTATPLGEATGLVPHIVDDVAEYDRHSNEYVPVEELKATNDPRWKEMLDGCWSVAEETEQEFVDRVFRGIESIVVANQSSRVAVVCHGGVINAYIARVLGLGNQRGFFYPNYTSIHRIAAARSGERSIVTINETSHLRGMGLPMGLFQK
ncbi:MAG: histidine phosphatase family protein [Actinomycetota bacterium]